MDFMFFQMWSLIVLACVESLRLKEYYNNSKRGNFVPLVETMRGLLIKEQPREWAEYLINSYWSYDLHFGDYIVPIEVYDRYERKYDSEYGLYFVKKPTSSDVGADEVVIDGEIVKRDLPENGVEGWWIHVFNGDFNPLNTIDQFLEISGEVCASDPEDWSNGRLLNTRGAMVAAIIAGPAVAVWDRDVWSDIDPVTGRRYMTGTGSERTEAWVVPSNCQLVGIICTKESWKSQLSKYNVPIYSLPNGHGKEE